MTDECACVQCVPADCDRDVPCERCGEFIWWDETPHPLCDKCAAIVLENCGTCAHSNDEDTYAPDVHTRCTLRGGFYSGKLMEKSARCARWETAE